METEFLQPRDACDRCGREALGVVGDETLCESCYHEAGACCGEFGVKEDTCAATFTAHSNYASEW